jgi:hypothetical protein
MRIDDVALQRDILLIRCRPCGFALDRFEQGLAMRCLGTLLFRFQFPALASVAPRPQKSLSPGWRCATTFVIPAMRDEGNYQRILDGFAITFFVAKKVI